MTPEQYDNFINGLKAIVNNADNLASSDIQELRDTSKESNDARERFEDSKEKRYIIEQCLKEFTKVLNDWDRNFIKNTSSTEDILLAQSTSSTNQVRELPPKGKKDLSNGEEDFIKEIWIQAQERGGLSKSDYPMIASLAKSFGIPKDKAFQLIESLI